ncbi:unnamed protein product [Clonostachys rosea]|uniref:F-box domain-containing protein n=1 Tax=Bionectria ochroleuca TaxID=29856 RepID=A0ABY6UXE9_BIOOC|nr:unnamed protein product [Clonostachys rosea]
MKQLQSRRARRAMRQCFTTPEIFERILLNLDIRELLFAQLVHTHFKTFIEQSNTLQRTLFFAPDPTRTTPELHPILKRRFPALLSLKIPDCVHYLNKLHDTICTMDWYTDEFYRERMLRESASWRRMFPVQPPAKLDSIKIYTYDYCIHNIPRCIPAQLGSQYQQLQETGIKMGLLYDLVVHLNSANPYPMIYIHWQMFPMEKKERRYYDLSDLPDGLEDLYQFDPEKEQTKNSITLYHQHSTFCGNDMPPESLLKINSPFISMVEDDLTTLLRFLKNPDIEGTSWGEYLKPERRAQIKARRGR